MIFFSQWGENSENYFGYNGRSVIRWPLRLAITVPYCITGVKLIGLVCNYYQIYEKKIIDKFWCVIFFFWTGNVFIHRNEKFLRSPESGMESCDEFDDEETDESPAILYKIGMINIADFSTKAYHGGITNSYVVLVNRNISGYFIRKFWIV